MNHEWRDRAACRGAQTDVFFPDGTAGPALRDIGRAKRICGGCPVRARCLDWALDHGAAFGIWGGFTEDERRAIRGTLVPAAAVRGVAGSRMSQPVQELIQAQVTAIHVACRQLTAQRLEGLRRGVEQARRLPARFSWDRKAAAHAEIFTMLADAVRDPVLRQVLNSGADLAHHLMMAAGPAADGMICNSLRRMLTCLRAGDPGSAADELESQLRILHFMSRLAGHDTAAGALA
jgi:WhiB family transcriptional regulator, redox-sensing transcriptional regulator